MRNKHSYRTALVCECGHLITGDCSSAPDALYCSQCGKPCISACPSCHAPIRGDYYERCPNCGLHCGSALDNLDYAQLAQYSERLVESCTVPAYCHNCGEPYPWTETLLCRANEIVDFMDELSDEEKSALKECFPFLLSDAPDASYHALVASKLLRSVSSIAKTALQNLLADHLSAFFLTLLGWKS